MRAQQTLSDESVAAVALDERSGAWRADGTVVGRGQKPTSTWLVTFRRLRRSKTAMFGMIIACLVFVVAASGRCAGALRLRRHAPRGYAAGP